MGGHCLRAHDQGPCDVRLAEAPREQREDLALAGLRSTSPSGDPFPFPFDGPAERLQRPADACKELALVEGLREVVVCSEEQAGHVIQGAVRSAETRITGRSSP